MALIVLDPCNLGLGPTPDGGIAIQISEVEGFEGHKFVIPVGHETAIKLQKQWSEFIKTPVEVANLADLQEVRKNHGY